MTRDEAEELRERLREQYPDGDAEVTRVWGGAEVYAGDPNLGGWVFMRTTGDSPLLRILADQRRAAQV